MQTTKSFSRYEPPSPASTPARNRARTTNELLSSPRKDGFENRKAPGPEEGEDVFENDHGGDGTQSPTARLVASPTALNDVPAGLDELPIELVSLTDRFAASLTTAKIYATPPSIDRLCSLFQDFYLQADTHIATHIQALSLKQARETSPVPSTSSRTSTGLNPLARINSNLSQDVVGNSEKPAGGQKMLTASEISERRKARKMLSLQKHALEEAVERKACEEVYDKIWRHKSTLDEVRDEKLRSRTAALALVGIGLKDLGVDFDAPDSTSEDVAGRASKVDDWIAKARQSILAMNDFRHPLGKLRSLALTHRTIVDLLSALYHSNSSADQILPTLIYTLITCPPEGVNVISNLCFIQRFRSVDRIDGEAAYCLTNLEAAITFLETVDLATLRSEEAIDSGSRASSRTSTPSPETMMKSVSSRPVASPVAKPLSATSSSTTLPNLKKPLEPSPNPTPVLPSPCPSAHHRRLSSLLQPSSALGAAGDAMKSTADQGLRNVSAALDNSFNFLFGRLKEQRISSDSEHQEGVVEVPKTLDDARRLVSPRLMDEDGALSETSSLAEPDDAPASREERLIEMIAGKSKDRDRSADSAKSSHTAGKRSTLTTETKGLGLSTSPSPSPAPSTAVDSVRSLGSSFNPLNRLASMNVMRGFGKSAAPASDASSSPTPAPVITSKKGEPSLVPFKVDPPIKRFLEAEDAGELKVGEVQLLLKDYQRLAKMLVQEGLL